MRKNANNGNICVSEYRENIEHGKETQFDKMGVVDSWFVYNKTYNEGRLIKQELISHSQGKPFYTKDGVIVNAAYQVF